MEKIEKGGKDVPQNVPMRFQNGWERKSFGLFFIKFSRGVV